MLRRLVRAGVGAAAAAGAAANGAASALGSARSPGRVPRMEAAAGQHVAGSAASSEGPGPTGAFGIRALACLGPSDALRTELQRALPGVDAVRLIARAPALRAISLAALEERLCALRQTFPPGADIRELVERAPALLTRDPKHLTETFHELQLILEMDKFFKEWEDGSVGTHATSDDVPYYGDGQRTLDVGMEEYTRQMIELWPRLLTLTRTQISANVEGIWELRQHKDAAAVYVQWPPGELEQLAEYLIRA